MKAISFVAICLLAVTSADEKKKFKDDGSVHMFEWNNAKQNWNNNWA
jgi:hypothetical protein